MREKNMVGGMMRIGCILATIMAVGVGMSLLLTATAFASQADDPLADPFAATSAAGRQDTLADPLEPLNRFFFTVNDRLYFWALKPVATGYAKVVPEETRLNFRYFFYNLLAPVRVISNLLQGKIEESGIELARFVINSTIGIAGFDDPAAQGFGLHPSNEDLGQTLGVYGLGSGFYICWPILGPSTLRDSFGMVGDSFLNPLSYLIGGDMVAGGGVYVGKEVNDASLVLGDYEQFTEAAFDPYVAIRDAYHQYRSNQVRDLDNARNTSFVGEPGGKRPPFSTVSAQ